MGKLKELRTRTKTKGHIWTYTREKTNGGENKAQKTPHTNTYEWIYADNGQTYQRIIQIFYFWVSFSFSVRVRLRKSFLHLMCRLVVEFALHEMINITYLAIYFSLYLIHHCACKHCDSYLRVFFRSLLSFTPMATGLDSNRKNK